MKIKLSQLRKLIREAVEEELAKNEAEKVEEAELDEYDGSYSRGGAGGNRHGDSWDEEPKRAKYDPYAGESSQEREERWAEKERNLSSNRWD